MGIVACVNFGNCPNYVLLNAPLRRTIFGMGGDAFLTGMPFTNRNQPLVPQVSDRFQTGFLGSLHSNMQWFHRCIQTCNGSTGSTHVLWVQHPTGSRQVPWVQARYGLGSAQVPDRFLGFNRGTVGIVACVNFGNCPNYTFCLMHHCAAPFLEWAGMRF